MEEEIERIGANITLCFIVTQQVLHALYEELHNSSDSSAHLDDVHRSS